MAISSNGLAGLKTGVVDNAASRPSSPYEGQMVYEKDIDMLAIWNGTAWRYVGSAIPSVTSAIGGSILQIVQAEYGTQITTASSSFIDTGLTATITPKSSSSKVLAIISQNCYTDAATTGCSIQLFRGATGLKTWVDISYGTGSGALTQNTFLYLDSPATTSATTYKTQFARRVGTGTAFVQANSATGTSTIILMEIAG